MKSETTGYNLRCRPNDLAIVTRCDIHARIGLLVLIVARSGNGSHDWLAEIQGQAVFACGALTKRPMRRRNVWVNDGDLTPIRGDSCQMAHSGLESSEVSI